MKSLFLLLFIVVATNAMEANSKEECKCWEDFEPQNDGQGWHCRGKKNHRIFGCNEEKPPLCICKEKGKDVALDVGEVNCVSIDHTRFDNRDCEPHDQWEEFFKKNPHLRLYN